MTEEEPIPDDMTGVWEIHARLANSLPKYVSVAELGVTIKTPFLVLSLREALIWRTEELTRNAIAAIERRDMLVAAILARTIMEDTALLARACDLLHSENASSEDSFNKFVQMMFGSREWADGPQALNILTCVQALTKKIEAFAELYDGLSEFVHPNWKGVSMLYSRIDREKHICEFGPQADKIDRAGKQVLVGLHISLMLFENFYNKISDSMPAFLDTLQKI